MTTPDTRIALALHDAAREASTISARLVATIDRLRELVDQVDHASPGADPLDLEVRAWRRVWPNQVPHVEVMTVRQVLAEVERWLEAAPGNAERARHVGSHNVLWLAGLEATPPFMPDPITQTAHEALVEGVRDLLFGTWRRESGGVS